MNIKHNILYLLAAATVAACSPSDDEGGQTNHVETAQAMAFNTAVAPLTRATETGATAAATLGNAFYVYGVKNEDNGYGGSVVFNNYKLTYSDGTSSTTNTAGWEYVGIKKTENENSNILIDGAMGTAAPTTQLIKYWDANADNYTFTAFAVAGGTGNDLETDNDLETGKVKVNKITNNYKDVTQNGYTFTIDADATPANIYLADRKSLTKESYNQPVQFTFRNAMAKVRVGMYETIPGYSLTIDDFKIADEADASFGDMTTTKTDAFAANLPCEKSGAGTLSVVYDNQPLVTFTPTGSKNNILTLGDNLNKAEKLGTTAAEAVYDRSDKAFTMVYPMSENVSNLKLKIDFTLKATTGEFIKVKDATAEIPAAFLQWKPGYAYTYLFKITNQTNGVIGQLTGLYPITFDAVTVSDGAGKEEVISTTRNGGTVNIVTVGYDPETKTSVTGSDAYNTGNTVYASVIKDNAAVDVSSSNTLLYIATTDDAENYPVTEATVEKYLANYDESKSSVNEHVIATPVTECSYDENPPMATGTISAMSWTASKHVYAVEYTYTGSDNKTVKTYRIVKIDGFNGLASGSLALDNATLTNTGGKIIPTLTVEGQVVPNKDVEYSLDYKGEVSATDVTAVPEKVTVKNGGTADVYIDVPTYTTATPTGKKYYVTAKYNRRTYTAAFMVSQ